MSHYKYNIHDKTMIKLTRLFGGDNWLLSQVFNISVYKDKLLSLPLLVMPGADSVIADHLKAAGCLCRRC